VIESVAIAVLLSLVASAQGAASDPNSSSDNTAASAPPSAQRRGLDFKVFTNVDRPVAGEWEIEIPDAAHAPVRIREAGAGEPGALVGVHATSGDEVLRLTRKKDGVGYEGQILKLFGSCGLDALPVVEFLPLGDAIVLRFETQLPIAPCPPIDGGRAGRLYVVSRRGGPVKLRDLSGISSPTVRDTYSIGGDRPQVEVKHEISTGGVSVEDGSEVRFLQRVKAPLDSTFWFEVEGVVSAETGVEPPRGYLRGDALRFIGSLTLKRIKQDAASPR